MSEDQDQSQKTEEPTRKRLDEARQKGQLVTSREINNFFMLCAFTVIAVWLTPHIMMQAQLAMLPFIESPENFIIDEGSFKTLFAETSRHMGMLLALPLAISIIAALSAGMLQSKFNFSWTPLMPDLNRISPLKGLERLFSLRSVVELIKGIIKISIVGIIAYLAVAPYMPMLNLLPAEETSEMLAFLLALTKRMLLGIIIALFFIAILDYLYQYFEYIKNLRMTKQEVKDEYKQQEGDPKIKQKLRAIRAERAKKRMMAEVPKSDVVITNPTHYAVALRYDMETMAAPILVAKGADKVALRIREIAQEHKIIVMRNPPLARALYDNVEIGYGIPQQHYKAVAEVIGYVYRLKGKKMPKNAGATRVIEM